MAGTLTRDEFVTEVCNTVGKSVSALAVSGVDLQTRVRVYLGWAQQRIARFASFPELTVIQDAAATVASVKRYPLETGTNNLGLVRPKEISSVILIDSENSRRLNFVHHTPFEKRFPRPENYSTGRPSVYTRIGNALELFYIPDAVYTLRIIYQQWPTPFTTAGQTTDFDDKDQLLVATTVMETYLALEEYQDAAVWFNRVKGMLQDVQQDTVDVDWTPKAEGFEALGSRIESGTPWLEPGADPGDPLYGYPE